MPLSASEILQLALTEGGELAGAVGRRIQAFNSQPDPKKPSAFLELVSGILIDVAPLADKVAAEAKD